MNFVFSQDLIVLLTAESTQIPMFRDDILLATLQWKQGPTVSSSSTETERSAVHTNLKSNINLLTTGNTYVCEPINDE